MSNIIKISKKGDDGYKIISVRIKGERLKRLIIYLVKAIVREMK